MPPLSPKITDFRGPRSFDRRDIRTSVRDKGLIIKTIRVNKMSMVRQLLKNVDLLFLSNDSSDASFTEVELLACHGVGYHDR